MASHQDNRSGAFVGAQSSQPYISIIDDLIIMLIGFSMVVDSVA
jgi:hypothetical protein